MNSTTNSSNCILRHVRGRTERSLFWNHLTSCPNKGKRSCFNCSSESANQSALQISTVKPIYSRNQFLAIRSASRTGSSIIQRRSFTASVVRNSPPQKGDKVVVAMSGGVDSSVTALLLSQQDFDLRAVYMRNWSTLEESTRFESGSGGSSGCEWQEEWRDVQKVCQHLGGIPVELIDLSREYWVNVFEPALGDWESGTTPNPDVNCNREIKFGALMDRVFESENEDDHRKTWLATGHYGHVEWSAPTDASPYPSSSQVPRPRLLRAKDRSKDQTYYLSSVKEDRLAKAYFPLAPYLKSEVRELARKYDLPTASRKESMGICFIGNRKGPNGFGGFLDSYITSSPGSMITPGGEKVGTHNGLHTLTVGQGARIKGALSKYFVAKKLLDSNQVVVVQGKDHPLLLCKSLNAEEIRWIWSSPPREVFSPEGLEAFAQVRHRQEEVKCTVRSKRDSSGGDRCEITFEDPLLAVSPGQIVGLWKGDWCLGSGTIGEVTTLGD